jgi:adenosylmethionine-8-amino-7-oxononanoate aminotransferase
MEASGPLDHLWLHFTEMGGYADPADLQVIVRGDGCYLEDSRGRRYLDALAGLFCVNVGYGYGEEMGEAAAAQMRELPFAINWTFAHPRAIELAAEIASVAPGDLNRAFFVSGGSEAVEAAWKLARQYHAARGERRWKAVARRVAYHGTTMGALSITGCTELRTPFEPLVPDVVHVANTNRFHRPRDETEQEFTQFLLDDLEQAIVQAGPDTVAMVIMEPVQNSGGAYTPPAGYFEGVRAICDEHGILLCADEVICGFGRLGHWFGSERFDIRPDLITSAKGMSSAYASIGALIASERVMEPFTKPGAMYSHGMTFGGHPVQAAVALKNIEIMPRSHRRGRARARVRVPRRARAAARAADRG